MTVRLQEGDYAHETMVKVGKWIAHWRERKRMTRTKMCAIMLRNFEDYGSPSIAEQWLTLIEKGKCTPRFEVLIAIADALGVELRDIMPH